VSDDWFFARIFDTDIIAYGSEKNFYIRSELAGIWPEFAELVGRSKMDQEGRGVIDLRFAIGKGRILPLTTLRHLIILHRVMDSNSRSSVISSTAAMSMIRDSGYFNPHLIVKDEEKSRIRDDFFMQLLRRVKITLINTAGIPEESQDLIREAVGLK
jgi:hypothetical protein